MNLFLKIMIIVGFGIFTVSGVHSQEAYGREDILFLRFIEYNFPFTTKIMSETYREISKKN